jgi:hypothetical protein
MPVLVEVHQPVHSLAETNLAPDLEFLYFSAFKRPPTTPWDWSHLAERIRDSQPAANGNALPRTDEGLPPGFWLFNSGNGWGWAFLETAICGETVAKKIPPIMVSPAHLASQ